MEGVAGDQTFNDDLQMHKQTGQQPSLEHGDENGGTKEHAHILTKPVHLELLKILILIIF